MLIKPRTGMASDEEIETELHAVILSRLRSSFSLLESCTQAKLTLPALMWRRISDTASVKQNWRFY